MKSTLKTYRIYLDSCCICRPSDDQTQNRIQRETAAVLHIIAHFQSGEWHWVNSGILRNEINQISDFKKYSFVKTLLNSIPQTDYVSVGKTETLRGKQFETLGFKEHDALHLACAESGNVDIFLTTDDSVIKKAKQFCSILRVPVENPKTWLKRNIVTGGD